MEKSQEYLGEKTLNLFMEIKNVLVLFVDKKIDSDVHEIVVNLRIIIKNTAISLGYFLYKDPSTRKKTNSLLFQNQAFCSRIH